jgi:hypothetical protein
MSMWNFNHLLGRGASASEDDEDDKQKSKKAKSRAEEDDKDKEDAEDDDQDDDKDDDKKEGKKAKSSRADDSDDDDDDADAEEDDEDDDEEKDKKKDAKKAERDRCARIFASKHAAGRPSLAASLAFNTPLSAKAAIAVLASSGLEVPAGRKSLDARMQELPSVTIGSDGDAGGQSTSAIVNRAATLYNEARGKK